MNVHNKKPSFWGGSKVFYNTFGKPFFFSNMKLTTLFLSFFSIITFNIEANTQQVPAKAKAVSIVKPIANKKKTKAKKTKKVVVVKKDTISDIDPANVNSPLYNKN